MGIHQTINAGPIIQSREDGNKGHYRHAPCLACEGTVVMYDRDLGSCNRCGRDFYMQWMGKNKYRCRRIPR